MKLKQRLIHDITGIAMILLVITTCISTFYLCCKLAVFFFTNASWDDALTIAVIVTAVSAVLGTACYAVHDHYCRLPAQS